MSGFLGFTMEWFDSVSNIMHSMYLKFFLDDNTLEILTDKSTFLKRIYYPEVTIADLFIGSTITIHNRLYMIKSYSNKFTTDYMLAREVHFIAVFSASTIHNLGKLLNAAAKNKLVLGHAYTSAMDVYNDHISVQRGDIVVEIVGNVSTKGFYDNFLSEAQRLDRSITITQLPADATLNLFDQFRSVSVRAPCTLLLVKPHMVRSSRIGDLLQTVINNSSYKIAQVMTVHMTIAMAEELFIAYRGILQDYSAIVEHMTSGPALAIALVPSNSNRGNSKSDDYYDFEVDAVGGFRDFVGPQNPQLARVLRPDSLRALYGINALDNAVHCTDLSEDGEMECRFFFDTLANL